MAVFTRRQFSEEKRICHMTKPTITPLPDPTGFSPDPLTDILRSGARRLIEQAVEAELSTLLTAHADETTEDGRSRRVRHLDRTSTCISAMVLSRNAYSLR